MFRQGSCSASSSIVTFVRRSVRDVIDKETVSHDCYCTLPQKLPYDKSLSIEQEGYREGALGAPWSCMEGTLEAETRSSPFYFVRL